MKIDQGLCIKCRSCIPYCPTAAIKKTSKKELRIDEDECVECGVCKNSGTCPADAIYQDELKWPRLLKAKWSSVVFVHPETNIQGRGTDEMKTNDVTSRFKLGEVGFGLELGRPSFGTRFLDVEKVTKAIASHDIVFEPMNPLTSFIDLTKGEFLESWNGYPLNKEFETTKVMTVIIEFKAKQQDMLKILKTVKSVAQKINTVMSIEIISKCTENGKIPIIKTLEKEKITIYINGKTNIGLGKPKFRFQYNN
jgi:NAD-dependent dihydropyrimidine dehydrogenase PreA subunit